ncbi:MAG TPA: glycosyltransferase [Bacteroidales bacterium]|nr:glycosyltransferase [Bacteroidales bacterium]
MDRRLHILFLPRWYPDRYDPMPGLFIQRQAEALAAFCDVAVIYAVPDPLCPSALESDFCNENGVRVLRVYYQAAGAPGSWFGRLREARRFWRMYRMAFRSIRGFEPDVIHSHILTRMGVIGWLLARKNKTPLVISEHWSRYLEGSDSYRGIFRKWMTRFVVGKAAVVTAVSGPLREAMRRCGIDHPQFHLVPNVVMNGLCEGMTGSFRDRITIVHISCFDDRSKNISGFLRSVKEVSKDRSDFTCLLVGDGPDRDRLQTYAMELGLESPVVQFVGLKTGSDLAEVMSSADFTVLSSRFETFGTVVIESLACGIPVLATRTGVAADEVNENNGMLVPTGDEQAMTEALGKMLDRCRSYDRELIRKGIGDRYSAAVVGQQLSDLYRIALSQRHR